VPAFHLVSLASRCPQRLSHPQGGVEVQPEDDTLEEGRLALRFVSRDPLMLLTGGG